MKIQPNINIVAHLEINSDQAEIIEHLCSYNLVKEFSSKFSHRFTEDRMKQVLNGVRDQCRKLVEARDEAVKLIFERMK